MKITGSDETGEQLAQRVADLILDAANNAPRSLQKRIGPSEVGNPCERALAYKLLDWPTTSADGDPIASVIGTGFHTWMAEVFDGRNTGDRYKVEERVTVLQALTEAGSITGSSDLYDRHSGTVFDWKLVGVSSLDKYRLHGPGDQYRRQAHLYGLGQEAAGETPLRVAIVFIGRYHELRVHVWTEPYIRKVALDALARLDLIRDKLAALDPEANPETWNAFPTSDSAKCRFCDWFRHGSTDLSRGCPGTGQSDAGASLKALIA